MSGSGKCREEVQTRRFDYLPKIDVRKEYLRTEANSQTGLLPGGHSVQKKQLYQYGPVLDKLPG